MKSKPFGLIVAPEDIPTPHVPRPRPQETIPTPLPQAIGPFTPGLYSSVALNQQTPAPAAAASSLSQSRPRIHPFKRVSPQDKKFSEKAYANHKVEMDASLPVPLPVCYNEQQQELESKTQEEAAGAAANPTLVTEYLRYAYTSNDKDLEVEIAKLFIIEDIEEKKFRYRELIAACQQSILKAVTESNAVNHYSHGEKIKSEIITDTCFDYIKKNKKDIWKTQEEFQKACDDLPSLMYKLLVE